MITLWGDVFQLTWVTLGLVFGIVSASAMEKKCVVPASGTNTTDDAPAILEAFQRCGHGGIITFSPNTTYYVNSVMNVTWLEHAIVDIQGTLLVRHPIYGEREKQEGLYCSIGWLIRNPVEYGYPILVEQISGRGLPEPVDCLHSWRRRCPNPRAWCGNF